MRKLKKIGFTVITKPVKVVTDEKRFKKENPKEYKLWRLVQLIILRMGKKMEEFFLKLAKSLEKEIFK